MRELQGVRIREVENQERVCSIDIAFTRVLLDLNFTFLLLWGASSIGNKKC